MTVAYIAVDLETTGLDERQDSILEVAWAPLTADFEQLEPTTSLVVEMTEAAKARLMANDYTRKMHVGNGLIADSLARGLALPMVEKMIDADLERWDWADGRLTIFGSSVHFDLRFVQHHMPNLAKWLHYRVLDVTTLISFGRAAGMPEDENRAVAHRAADDINWSISAAQGILSKLRRDVRPGGVW